MVSPAPAPCPCHPVLVSLAVAVTWQTRTPPGLSPWGSPFKTHLPRAILAKPMLRCGQSKARTPRDISLPVEPEHVTLQHDVQADTNGVHISKCHVDGDLGMAPVPSPRLGAAALLSLAAIQGDWPVIERVFCNLLR